MNTISTQTKTATSGFFDNPIIKKLAETNETSSQNVTYKGVAKKCAYFIVTVVIGVALAFLLNAVPSGTFISEDGIIVGYAEAYAAAAAAIIFIISPFVAMFARRTIPISGTLYCMSTGYIYTFAGNILPEFKSCIFLALIITVAIFISLMLAYMSGKVKVTKKFSFVAKVLFGTLIISSLLLVIAYFIPGLNQASMLVISNPTVSIAFSVIGIAIVSMFLLSDFKKVTDAVENNLPKKYEWTAAFGIIFSVIWLFIEVVGLIAKIQDNN